jgi:hypothetical protein
MQALGIISNESFREDFDVLFNRVSPDVIEELQEKKIKQQAAEIYKNIRANQLEVSDENIKKFLHSK